MRSIRTVGVFRHGSLPAVCLATLVVLTASPRLTAQPPVPTRRPVQVRAPEATGKQRPTSKAVAGQASPPRRSASAQPLPPGRVVAPRQPSEGVRLASAETDGGGVVLAGGVGATADCEHCGRRGCGHCRAAGGRLGLHCNGRCDAGTCPAHCPVRPDQFGYYATRWRSWPGQGVKQVSHFDPATTPVIPPMSEVPGMEDEGRRQPAGSEGDDPLDEEGNGRAADGKGDAGMDDAAADDPQDVPQDAPKMDDSGDTPATEPEAPADASSNQPLPASGSDAASRRVGATGLDISVINGRLQPGDGLTGPARETVAARGEKDEGVIRASAPLAGDALPAVDAPRSSPPASGWRPAGRRSSGGPAVANPLRGVTTYPGNPLR